MISVCLAVFNGEKYLQEQLQSILVQLSADDEVIVVDDCSHDGSVNLIVGLDDRRIVLLRNPSNVGPSASFERAVSRARGDYIFLSDQDDIWRLDKVSTILDCLAKTHALVVVSDARIVDADGMAILPSMFSLRHSGIGFWRNLCRNGFVGCCMAIRSEVLSFVTPFPVHRGLHDEWIGLCCSIAGRVEFLHEPLIDYRRHRHNVTQLRRGSMVSMGMKRASLMFAVSARLPRILGWRLRRQMPLAS